MAHSDGTGTWPDWATLAYAAASVVLLAAGSAFVWCKRRYPPLKERNVPLVLVMAAAGAVHVTAALVANGHFGALASVEHAWCVLWNYWLQYMLGVCPWVVGVFLRLLTHASVFTPQLSEHGSERARRYRWLLAAAIAVPLLALCLWLTAYGGAEFDRGAARCHSEVLFKLLLLAWVVNWTLLLVVGACVARCAIDTDFGDEFAPLAQTVLLGIGVIAVNGFAQFSGSIELVLWRVLATCSVATLHVFTFARLVGPRAYYSVAGNNRYADWFMSRLLQFDLKLDGIGAADSELRQCTELMDDFVEHCLYQPVMRHAEAGARAATEIAPQVLVDCYREIGAFHAHSARMTAGQREQRHKTIVNKYLIAEQTGGADAGQPNPWFTHVPGELALQAMDASPDDSHRAFDRASEWIVRVLDAHFGAHYVNRELPKRDVYERNVHVRDIVRRAKLARLKTRQLRAGLVDGYRLVSGVHWGADAEETHGQTELQEIVVPDADRA